MADCGVLKQFKEDDHKSRPYIANVVYYVVKV